MQGIRFVFLALVISAVCLAKISNDIVEFKKFMTKYEKNYEKEELSARFKIFQDNLKRIDQLNARNTKTTFGVTKFADLTPKEFKNIYLSKVSMKAEPSWPMGKSFSDEDVQDTPQTWDWRQKGAVTPVKNQGMCGSCWAFSAVGNMEGQWFLGGNTLVGLSEQNLVDCDHECMQYEGEQVCDQGCDGGLMPNAFEYVIKGNGIDTESSYEYTGYDGDCAFKNGTIGATIKDWTMIPGNETQMATWLVNQGPISIAVDAELWQYYLFGIFEFPWCGTDLDHGVLIVGYDWETDDFGQELNYWWVKNSWGDDWGYDGYIKLAKGSNQCGDNLFPCTSRHA